MPDWLVGTSVVSPWGPLCQEAYGKSRDLQMRSRRGGGGGRGLQAVGSENRLFPSQQEPQHECLWLHDPSRAYIAALSPRLIFKTAVSSQSLLKNKQL